MSLSSLLRLSNEIIKSIPNKSLNGNKFAFVVESTKVVANIIEVDKIVLTTTTVLKNCKNRINQKTALSRTCFIDGLFHFNYLIQTIQFANNDAIPIYLISVDILLTLAMFHRKMSTLQKFSSTNLCNIHLCERILLSTGDYYSLIICGLNRLTFFSRKLKRFWENQCS